MPADRELHAENGIDALADPVCCDCGWFGLREDCAHLRCPNCGDRVVADKRNEGE